MTGSGGVVTAREPEVIESEGNSNLNRNGTTASQLAEPTSVARCFEFATWLKSFFCSRHNPTLSLSDPPERRELAIRESVELESSIVVQQEGHGGATTEADVSSAQEHEPAHQTNAQILQDLQRRWPEAGDFFTDYGGVLEVGKKIAQGMQGEIFEAKFEYASGHVDNFRVLKVFKEGLRVQDLEKQWPLGMFERMIHERSEGRAIGYNGLHSAAILRGTVVKNGRLAFEMWRRWGDLRKLIDRRMERNNNKLPPLSDDEIVSNMRQIAEGMVGLHRDNIIHRDLKAANVIIRPLEGENWKENSDVLYSPSRYRCEVADFECSGGVVGTGFWRAPEILEALKAHNVTQDLFTQASGQALDVYSYAMTCYEMITGGCPFKDKRSNDYDVVLRGERPSLPNDTKLWIEALLSRCWHQDPLERPSFVNIVETINNRS